MAFAGNILNRVFRWSTAIGGALVMAQSAVFTVDGGHRAVVFDRIQGVKKNVVLGEGMHFIIPFLQYPFIYEVRTRPRDIVSKTGSKDLQTVEIGLRLLFKPDEKELPTLHSELGPDYDERVIPSIANEVIKSVVAQYDASELITLRERVSQEIRHQLELRAQQFGILLDDVSIIQIEFSREFSSSIEAKQVASQEAERSKYVVLKSQQEKKAAIIRAEGEAEAARLLIEAMETGDGFVELRKIEGARDIAETMARSRNVVYVPGGGNMLLQLPAQTTATAPSPR